MKKRIFSIACVAFLFGISVFSQVELIIDENFQDWPASEGVVSDPPADCESLSHQAGPFMQEIDFLTGGSGTVTLIKYVISPECNTKRVNQGENTENAIDVTTGFISLTKLSAETPETDTVGQMYLPQLSNVTQIEFGYSCTSSSRGVRLYTSVDGGETWEGPWTADGPGVGEIIGSDTKLGEMVVLDINRDNVILKFTSGIDTDGISQVSRIHNIKVWGVPGSKETGIKDFKGSDLRVYYSSGIGLVVEGELTTLEVYDLTGRKVFETSHAENQTLDLSVLTAGVYMLRAVDQEERMVHFKFLKN